ncbi:MAG: glycosyltransferase family 2 protein [Actinomycetia bacterium]|nr:glycosyltransferase family 2 protein [Actinomycetes bacterium]
MPELSVLMVSYQTPDLVKRCLDALALQRDEVDLEVVLVDNAPGDGTAALVAHHHPWVEVDPQDNVGFSRGVNRAAELASGDLLLLLNPDTEPHPGAMKALVEAHHRHSEAGLIGGRIKTPEGEVDPHSCFGEPSLWAAFCFATTLDTIFKNHPILHPESLGPWPRDTEREVDIISGALCLVARPVWDELGGLDERFWMYGEDTDFSMRATRAGYHPRITPDAVVTHESGASSREGWRKAMVLKGKITCHRKHRPAPVAQAARLLLIAGAAARALGARAVSAATRGRRGGSALDWVEVWRNRSDWSMGHDLT